MSKSPVEKLNELKEEELKIKQQQHREGEEEVRDNNLDPEVADTETFTQSPSDKSRKHKGHFGSDKEPDILE